MTLPGPDTASPRHLWADVARGVGISLVVFGHALRGLFSAGLLEDVGAWSYVDRFIYAFHMPLFLFLAGLFLGSVVDESFGQLALRRLRRLGYPYLLWASLQMAMQSLMSRHTNSPVSLVDDLWTIVYAPPMQFWFLYALLVQSLWLGLLDKLGVSRRLSFLIALALYALAPLLPLGWGVLVLSRRYLPYTALGFFLGAKRVSTWLVRPRLLLGFGALIGFGLVALAAGAPDRLDDRFVALGVALIGTFASLAACAMLASARSGLAGRVAQVLAGWGRASLAIFVAHTIASAGVRIVLQHLLHVDDVAIHLVLGTAVGVLAPVGLWRLSQRWHFSPLFEWPDRRAPSPKA